ncbi:MAG: glycosyltransferase family 2 protein [Chthoniobacterales bacterium]|nr:glycosyltransferase family 2 protein [Chthoniobacterales bacterium]
MEALRSSMQQPTNDEKVAVVVPLFPRMPGLRKSLESLLSQSRRPDTVVLLDDGTSKEADTAAKTLDGIGTEIVQVPHGPLPAAVNHVAKHLSETDYIAFLQAGDAYAPARIERCLVEMRDAHAIRPPAVAVTALVAVDSRGENIPEEDRRSQFYDRLWEPGRCGIGLADWLGAGNFAGPLSNLFVRRAFLEGNPLPEDVPILVQWLTVLTGLRGLLTVIDEPLLRHYPGGGQPEHSASTATDLLRMQVKILKTLGDKLPDSPETRRNLVNYHRAAWQNISGVREDLFQQVVLCLAADADERLAERLTERISNALGALAMPARLEDLLTGGDAPDLAAYASALRRTREDLTKMRAENERLGKIAEAAKNSGWIRFGAWLGDRSARRMLEMDELAVSGLQAPDGKIQGGGKTRPKPVGRKQPSGDGTHTEKGAQGENDKNAKDENLGESQTRAAQTEEEGRP